MRQLGTSSLLDALAIWGAHEASGRLRGQAQIDISDKFACADFALRYRAPLIAHILDHHPAGAVRVEFEPEDSGAVFLADGRTIDQWIASATGDPQDHFKRLFDAEDSPKGPLIGATHQSGPGPIVLYDGWHRAAAWHARNGAGRPACIEAHLILWTRF